MAQVQAQAGRIKERQAPLIQPHSLFVTLLETSDSDVTLLQGDSWWALAKHTKEVHSPSDPGHQGEGPNAALIHALA